MSEWLITTPVYGQYNWELFTQKTLPRIQNCLEGFANEHRRVRWIIHTDRTEEAASMGIFDKIVPVSSEANFMTFVNAHKEVWNGAAEGTRVCFLSADIIPSKESFFFADKMIEDHRHRAVVTGGIRTTAPEPPPIGADARTLLEFAMKWPNSIISDTFYGTGHSMYPTNAYFFNADRTSCVQRGFHLHPFAVVKQASTFNGTVDDDLLEGFDEQYICVVCDRQMALVEQSTEFKTMPRLDRPFTMDDFNACADHRARGTHKKFVRYQIRILGEEQCGDKEILASGGISTR